MATYRGIHKFRSILFGSNSFSSGVRVHSTHESKGPLDWNSGWFYYTIHHSIYCYMFYRLGQTGYFLFIFENIFEIFIVWSLSMLLVIDIFENGHFRQRRQEKGYLKEQVNKKTNNNNVHCGISCLVTSFSLH